MLIMLLNHEHDQKHDFRLNTVGLNWPHLVYYLIIEQINIHSHQQGPAERWWCVTGDKQPAQ